MIEIATKTSGERHAPAQTEVNRRVPVGQFAAVDGDVILAIAATHGQLVQVLAAQGRSPHGLVIIESGANYPDSAVIF